MPALEIRAVAVRFECSRGGRSTTIPSLASLCMSKASTAATVLGHMPITMEAFEDSRLSWSQVRAIVLSVRQLTRQFHREKTRGDWTIRAGPDGSRIVTHPASGWTPTTFPATRRIKFDNPRKRSKIPDPPV